MDYQSIIDKYYPSENELRRILLVHSRQVADRCLLIAKKHPELKLDVEFLEEAAMLHDIGIFRCNAPGIQCFGTEPYIRHGIIGGEILRQEGWGAMPSSVNGIRERASQSGISNSSSCLCLIRTSCLWCLRNRWYAMPISFIRRPIQAANALS